MAIPALKIPVFGKTVSVFDTKCGNRSTKCGNNDVFGYLSQQLHTELSLSSSLHHMFVSKSIIENVSAKYTAGFRLENVLRGRHVLLQSSWYGAGLRSRKCEHVEKFSFSENSVCNLQFKPVSSLNLANSSSQSSKGNNQLDVTVDRNLEQKYRPKIFEDLVGQGSIGKFLRTHVHKKKVKPAYLFSGPRGAGKTSAARMFAAAVNCEEPQNGNPCRNCRHCRTISKGNNTDVREIDAATNSGVESIRNLLESVRYSPQSAPFKVYIIDECHMLSKEAASALLKTLEEPPSHVLFILVTTDPQKLLESTMSRCDHYKFRKLANADIVLALQKVAEKEEMIVEESALQLLGELSSGSLRDALGMLGSVASAGEEITLELVEERFDVLPVSRMPMLLANSLISSRSKEIKPLLQDALWRSEPYQVLVGLVQLIVDIFAKDPRLYQRIRQPNEREALQYLVNMSESETGEVYLRRVLSTFRNAELQIRQAPYATMWLNTVLLELPLLQPLSLPQSSEAQSSEPLALSPTRPSSAIGNGNGFLSPEKVPALVSSSRVTGGSSTGSLSRDMDLQERREVNGEVSLPMQEKHRGSGLPKLEEKLGELTEVATIDSTESGSGDETVLGFGEEEREFELDTVDNWVDEEVDVAIDDSVSETGRVKDVVETGLHVSEEELGSTEATEKEREKVEDEKVEVVKSSFDGKRVVENGAIPKKTVVEELLEEVRDSTPFSQTKEVMEVEEVEEVEEVVYQGTNEEEGESIEKTQYLLEIKARAEELIQTKSHKSLLKGKGRIISISDTTVALEFPIGCMAGAIKPQTEKSFRRAFTQVLGRDVSISFEASGGSEDNLSPVEGELSVKRPKRRRPKLGEVKAEVKGEVKGEEKGEVKGEKGGQREEGEEGEEEREEKGGFATMEDVEEGGGESQVSPAPVVDGKRKSRSQVGELVEKGPVRRKEEASKFHKQFSDDEAKEFWAKTSESNPEKGPRKEKTNPREEEGGGDVKVEEGKTWADEINRFPSRPISEIDLENLSRNRNRAPYNRPVYSRRKGSEELTETGDLTGTEDLTEDPMVRFDTESGGKKTVKRGPSNKLSTERRANPSRSRMMAIAQNMARTFDGMVWSLNK